MNCVCNCSPLSPFRWAEDPRPSIFRGGDPTFSYGAATGKSRSQVVSERNEEFRERTDQDLGNVLAGEVVYRG